MNQFWQQGSSPGTPVASVPVIGAATAVINVEGAMGALASGPRAQRADQGHRTDRHTSIQRLEVLGEGSSRVRELQRVRKRIRPILPCDHVYHIVGVDPVRHLLHEVGVVAATNVPAAHG
jgi:hypothetical protein